MPTRPYRTNGKPNYPAYGTWRSIKRRCFIKTENRYHRYGGRGITLCERWMDFDNFYDDMGERPEGHSIERIDNDGNYEPGNCKWIPVGEQSHNRRNTLYLTYKGKTFHMMKWSRILSIPKSSLHRWVKQGMTLSDIVKEKAKVYAN